MKRGSRRTLGKDSFKRTPSKGLLRDINLSSCFPMSSCIPLYLLDADNPHSTTALASPGLRYKISSIYIENMDKTSAFQHSFFPIQTKFSLRDYARYLANSFVSPPSFSLFSLSLLVSLSLSQTNKQTNKIRSVLAQGPQRQ